MLPGVYIAKKRNGSVYYRSNITYRNKHISLGSYQTELKAHQAYMEASRLLADITVTLENLFHLESELSFEKLISLVNFRDNQIYFKNPIYLKSNFFIYYITPVDEFKFDIDDLFYYSSHKIMKRKGHLFVSDYGMQVNILSRYGIKNYALLGKDYVFVNGDSTDFRYSNIEIINKYYGVSRYEKGNTACYKARIHVNGNYILGDYPDEEMAAIAYNKAIDLAGKYGIKKQFTTNYINDFSPRKYAEIYAEIKLSEKYLQYLQSFSDKNLAGTKP